MKNRIMLVARVRSHLVNSWCCSQITFRAKTSELAQRLHCLKSINLRSDGFSLAEVVLALGVIAIAITAILGVLPVALSTGHSAQDDTRAAEIAQTVFGSLVAQAPSQFNNIQLPLLGNTTLSPAIDLTSSSSPTTPTLYAGNDAQLMQSQSAASAYAITIFTNNSPPGFTDVGYANQVTVRVAWPANAAAPNQTIRDFVRIISKY